MAWAASGEAVLKCAAGLLVVAASFFPVNASAQTLLGHVLEEGRNAPVAGAVISLVDRDGEPQAAATSDSLGRFLLAPPEVGEYVVEAVRVGYATTRSPLFALSVGGSVSFEIMMSPNPLGLEGLEVSVEREADELLGPFGLTPATLRNRWIDRDDIEKRPLQLGPRELIRWQNIPGIWVQEDRPLSIPQLCVTFRRGTGCALTLLNGVAISRTEAQALNPADLEAIAILTPVEATTFYGTGAGGGVVLMWTRSGRR